MTDDTTGNNERSTDNQSTSSTQTEGDSSEIGTVDERLTEMTISTETTDPAEPFDQTARLDEMFGDARLVGLGESTHGTREFFRMKHRLLRYLVREHGLRVFALEATFPESLALNEYVRYGEGDPKDGLDDIYFWTWNVDSVLQMIEWMRAFNEGRPPTDHVRFYGIDSQYTAGAIERLRGYFERTGLDIPPETSEAMESIDDSGEIPEQADQIETYCETANRLVSELRDVLSENRSRLVSAESERAWALATQFVTVIDQATTYREARARIEDDDNEAFRQTLRVRDQAMADNVDWILDYEDTDQIAIWGHDAHINRSKHAVRDRDVATPSMGTHLADRYGDDYVAVGFTFGSGTFQALSESGTDSDGESRYELQGQAVQSPVPGTIDETLSNLGNSVAVLDVRAAMEDETLASWLAESRETFSAGATYDPGSPEEYVTEYVFGEAFDVLCYVDETTRARSVDIDLPDP